jgi:hypothetical protein
MTQVKSRGFTIIELMLSMTFLAMLMLVIALTTMQIGNIYNKGITLREVDQAGRSVSASLQRDIATSVPFNVTTPVNSQYIVRSGDGARLCLGNYTYAWTLGQSITTGTLNKYIGGKIVRFARIADPGASLCQGTPGLIDPAKATELLASGDRDLVVQSFVIQQTAVEPMTGEALYAISMVIGTSDTTQLTADKSSCKPPSSLQGAENYCSVNRFDFVAHAGNTLQ